MAARQERELSYADLMNAAGFRVYATTERVPELAHETTPQAFVLASRCSPTNTDCS